MLINLHSHLEGRVRPATAAELAASVGLAEPPQGWEHALELTAPADLTVFLQKVAASYPFFGAVDNLARIACEAVEDAASDGGDYPELRFGPANHVRNGLDIDTVVRAVCEGAAEGTRRSGMPAGIVVAMLRDHDHERNLDVARAAARHAGAGVVGFDLAGDELLWPAVAPYVQPYAIAAAAGLGLTCHAAEAAPAAAAREAVALLGVARIGHGAHVADDPDAMAWAAQQGVVIEVCPTSNFYTGAIAALSEHPAARFRQAGIPLVLGDDNPVQTKSLLSGERRILSQVQGFSAADLRALDATSISAAFAEDSVRAKLRATLASS